MEKYELPIPPQRMPGNSSSSRPTFDRTFLKPLFLNVHCPSCGKKYRLDSRDAERSKPEFECLNCLTIFAFEIPVLNPNNIVTRAVEETKSSRKFSFSRRKGKTSPSQDPDLQDVKKCPKCFALNPKAVPECLKCGVLFHRLEGLPLEPQVGAIPSLVKAWQDLMGDYQNLRKHFEFVDRCEDLQAIPYALKKYEDLKSVQPQDEIAQSMLHKVLMRQFAKLNQDQIPWKRILKLLPLAVSVMLVLLGLILPSFRNLVGIGAAMAFVTIGFVVFLTGRLNPQDFW